MKFHGRRSKPASGEMTRGYKFNHAVQPRLSIVFPKEMFDRLVAEATKRQIPVSYVVREKIADAYDDK